MVRLVRNQTTKMSATMSRSSQPQLPMAAVARAASEKTEARRRGEIPKKAKAM